MRVLNFSPLGTKYLVPNVGEDSVPPNPIARENVFAIGFLKGSKLWSKILAGTLSQPKPIAMTNPHNRVSRWLQNFGAKFWQDLSHICPHYGVSNNF